ncbi:MAG: hypothetical protein N2508_14440 [Anaerolineae bacterium]|nr:hypothetical protein [Anaerolineae bacterium]
MDKGLSISTPDRLTSFRHWAEPSWAALCGVLASGRIVHNWESGDWLKLTLLLILVNAGWGTLWAVLSGTDWKASLALWRHWESNASLPLPPYAHPESPAARASRLLGQLLQWWREAVWPSHGLAIIALLTALVLSMVLSLLLGPDAIFLNLAALALMELSMTGTSAHQWDSLITTALPWIIGHAIFSPPPPPHSVGLALAFAITRAATLRLRSGTSMLTSSVAQLLSATILIVLRHPLAAGVLLLLTMPQLLPWPRTAPRETEAYARYAWPWLTAAMGVAAWAVQEL